MNLRQRYALEHTCRMPEQCATGEFSWRRKDGYSVVLTLNSGFE